MNQYGLEASEASMRARKTAMAKRLLDIALSSISLVVLSPLFGLAAIGIRLSSPGPIFYRAQRVGVNQTKFVMYKFRTMHVDRRSLTSVITAKNDPRVFVLGLWLRRLKIDELPQLLNVLRGEMAIVGPRPEDPRIVGECYAQEHFETLCVLPGLASPGSIYNYTHGEQMLDTDDPEKAYVERLLPIKLALDMVYVREASLIYDLRIIFRTALTILAITLGKRHFADPPEMKKAQALVYPVKDRGASTAGS